MPTQGKPLGPDNITVTQGDCSCAPLPARARLWPARTHDPQCQRARSLPCSCLLWSCLGPGQMPSWEEEEEMGREGWGSQLFQQPRVGVGAMLPFCPLHEIPKARMEITQLINTPFLLGHLGLCLPALWAGGADNPSGRESASRE